MGILHIGHIKSALNKRFAALIDLSDVSPNADREGFFLARSLAAFVVAELAEVDDKIAAKAVVDGANDNGIDAFYFDSGERTCYVVQSKWVHSGKSSVEAGDVHKLVQGLRDLLEFQLERFGKLQSKQAEIESALFDSNNRFVVVLAYTGEPELAPEARHPLDEFLKDQNEPTELLTFRPLRQADLYKIIAKQAVGEAINLQVMLHEWGRMDEPYLSYYGQLNLEDIGKWQEFGPSLYSRNLRGFKGSTDVNEGIIGTAKYSPENFWYFNNGITILCDSLSKLPYGGSSRDTGLFQCEGASVVNGAQTVGSVIEALRNGPNGFHNARVLVRLISLEKCPPEFGSDLTRAANTQNRIEKKDFAALDPQQDRLKTELLLECGKTYSYRTGERSPSADEGCTLDDAAVALACLQPDVGLCVQAKREVSKLYDDIEQAPYKILFNSSVSALKMWRAVSVLRAVDAQLNAARTAFGSGRERLISIHGNRFILHRVFRKIGASSLDSLSKDDFLKVLTGVDDITYAVLTATIAQASKLFSTSYPANLFKSTPKCTELAQHLGS